MKLKKLQITQGFTLLEVIIYMAIVSAILTVAIFFAWSIIGNQSKSMVVTEVSQNSRFILERVGRELRQASSIASLTSEQLVLNILGEDQLTFAFDDINHQLTRQLNEETATILNSSLVDVSGAWQNLSANDSATIGLDLTVTFKTNSNHTDWQACTTTSSSYELRVK
ncbi:MAG: type II secretion system protein [Candidatus Komeilibacteria bacterium]